VTGEPLSKEQRATGGSAVHWIFGSLMGAVYGAVAEVFPRAKSGFGLAYGTALWAGADEAGVPAFKLGPPPQKVSGEKHATEWGAHLALRLVTRIYAPHGAAHVVAPGYLRSKMILPPSSVRSTRACASWSAVACKMSVSSTTRSASLPFSMEPLMFSSNSAKAEPMV
jgi:hypothetical protein